MISDLISPIYKVKSEVRWPHIEESYSESHCNFLVSREPNGGTQHVGDTFSTT